jgi:hypothetical protein
MREREIGLPGGVLFASVRIVALSGHRMQTTRKESFKR